MKPTIITDLDGTLANIMNEVLATLHLRFDIPLIPEDCDTYDVAASFWPLLDGHCKLTSEAELTSFLDEALWQDPDVYERALPYWDLWQAYRLGLRCGAISLVALTGRPDSTPVMDATLRWLHDWGFDGIECFFSRTYPGGKLEVVRDILEAQQDSPGLVASEHPIWVIEDDLSAARAIQEALPSITVFVVDRPWTSRYWRETDGVIKCRYITQEIGELLDQCRRTQGVGQ